MTDRITTLGRDRERRQQRLAYLSPAAYEQRYFKERYVA